MNSDETPIPASEQVPEQPISEGIEEEPLVEFPASTEQTVAVETPTATEELPAEVAVVVIEEQVANLRQQRDELQAEIAQLKASRDQLLQVQSQTQATVSRLIQEGLSELEQRRQALQISVEQLERRQERIRQEMRSTFAGASQELAIRVQGFKDYLVGSLQDLASAAEQLELAPPEPITPSKPTREPVVEQKAPTPKFAEQSFQDQARQIRRILDQYRNTPDYYGPPWQLRRTFEPIHAERIANWFFTQGGRGALRTMGSRLQNILVASSAISVLRQIYGGRLRTLVLATTPERLGEWRRGLQDCLGITRTDFGPERGVVLFEAADALAQKADRLLKENQMPFIIIDETEDQINLSMLQFPMWLAFAPEPQLTTTSRDFF